MRCRAQFARIVDAARATGNFVRIDMEDSSVTEETIRIFFEFREKYPRVGIVLQAYLHRSPDDARRVAKVGGNVRVCKGIYVEPPEIAYQDRERIRVATWSSWTCCSTPAATSGSRRMTRCSSSGRGPRSPGGKLPREAYEFQMLLGVAGALRRRLVADGHRLRVYVPYGEAWYAYSVRRLKENPSIAGHVLKGLFHREERPG